MRTAPPSAATVRRLRSDAAPRRELARTALRGRSQSGHAGSSGCSITCTASSGPDASRLSDSSGSTIGTAKGCAILLESSVAPGWKLDAPVGGREDKVIASSFALLFLSKGLAPVLINKLNYASAAERSKPDDDTLPNWNLHPNDIRNLTEHISTLPRWPKLLTFQEVEMEKALAAGGVGDLLQAPILYLSGTDDPNFTDAEVQLLRAYIEQGGFILAVNNCNGAGFDRGIRSLASAAFPLGGRGTQTSAARSPDLPRRVQVESRKDRVVGGRVWLPDVVGLFPARPFLPVGQMARDGR